MDVGCGVIACLAESDGGAKTGCGKDLVTKIISSYGSHPS